MLTNLFDIRRPDPGWRASRVFNPNQFAGLTTAGTLVISRGTALGPHASDPNQCDMADGKNFIGFVMRDVNVGGPSLADHVYPNRLELPYALGTEVSMEKAYEVDAEGAGFLVTSGTGALSVATAVGATISFNDGRFYAAQTGDQVFYRVSAILTPTIAGNLRMRFETTR